MFTTVLSRRGWTVSVIWECEAQSDAFIETHLLKTLRKASGKEMGSQSHGEVPQMEQ